MDDVVVLEQPAPPPEPAPPLSSHVAVKMPRVVVVVQRELVTIGFTTGNMPYRIDHTGLDIDWVVGTRLVIDRYLADDLLRRLSGALLVVEELPESEWPVRLLPRLRTQTENECSYGHYCALRDQLVAESWARGKYG